MAESAGKEDPEHKYSTGSKRLKSFRLREFIILTKVFCTGNAIIIKIMVNPVGFNARNAR